MKKQNSVTSETKSDATQKEPEKEKEAYKCGFCGKDFESKLGLKKHLPKCEASPDEEPPEEKDEEQGMSIFGEDEDEDEEKAPATDEDYECGHCGHIMPKPYKHCPECGEVLEWR